MRKRGGKERKKNTELVISEKKVERLIGNRREWKTVSKTQGV